MQTASARPRRDARRYLRALLPLALIAFAIVLASGIVPVPYPGPLIVITLSLALTSVMLGDFLRGVTDWPVFMRPSGDDLASVGRWQTLRGAPARLQTGRFLLFAAAAGTGAALEWMRPGWLPPFFEAGPGYGLLAMIVGTFFIMGSLAGFLHRPAQRTSGCARLFVFAFLAVQLVLATGLVAVGGIEAANRGTVAAFVRSLNPFEQAARDLDLR